jgi:hypothetical protein
MIKKIWNLISNWKKERDLKKRLKELQKRDPFIYR